MTDSARRPQGGPVDHAVFCGVDVGKSAHHACALDPVGYRLHDRALPDDEAALLRVFTDLGVHGRVLVVVDQPASIGALAIAVARAMGVDVAYLPGLAMRRIANLHPGQSKTDARDAFVIAGPRAVNAQPESALSVDEPRGDVWQPVVRRPRVGLREISVQEHVLSPDGQVHREHHHRQQRAVIANDRDGNRSRPVSFAQRVQRPRNAGQYLVT